MHIKGLTDVERMVVWRRRRHWTQRRMARIMKIPLRQIVGMEGGVFPGPLRETLLIQGIDISVIRVVTTIEWCMLQRRRCPGFTQAAVAECLGCCRRWVMLMETGRADPAPLVRYWTSLGKK